MITLNSQRGIGHDLIAKAEELLERYALHQLRPRRLVSNKALVIDVGLRHRLISANAQKWELVTHERYNRLAK